MSPGSTPIPMYCAARLLKKTLASGGGLMRACADFGVDGVLNGPGFLCAASIPEHVRSWPQGIMRPKADISMSIGASLERGQRLPPACVMRWLVG